MGFFDELYFKLRTKISIMFLKLMVWIEDSLEGR